MSPHASREPRLCLLLLITICIACKPAPTPSRTKQAAAGPQVRATLVTIKTTMQPENRTHMRTIVVAGDRVRDTGEQDNWRLFDMKAKTVTFVDDAARTIRTEPLQAILTRRRAAIAAALPAHYPRVRLVKPGTKKMLQGIPAEATVIESGGYRRELWIGEHPAIPQGLFAMMVASESTTSPLAPMMRDVEEALLAARGFPLADRAEVAVGNEKVIVDRAVVSIADRQVADAMVAPPKNYRDLTPKPPAPKK
jgi:hypothetical protein